MRAGDLVPQRYSFHSFLISRDINLGLPKLRILAKDHLREHFRMWNMPGGLMRCHSSFLSSEVSTGLSFPAQFKTAASQ